MAKTQKKSGLIILKPRLGAISRRLDPNAAKQIRRYAADTGMAMWAWNDLHANLFIIFWFLLAGRDQTETRDRAHAIWHVIQSDSAQRDMLVRLAGAELITLPKILDQVTWIADRTLLLGKFRNVAAHVPATFSQNMKKIPSADPFASRAISLERFNELDHTKFWKVLTGDLIALSRYSGILAETIYWSRNLNLFASKPRALPHRPLLQSVPEIERIDLEINRRKQIAAPKLPRKSSRAKLRLGKKQKK